MRLRGPLIALSCALLGVASCQSGDTVEERGPGRPASGTEEGLQVVKRAEARDQGTLLVTGQKAPVFEAVTVDGQPLGTASLRGRSALIVFISVYCQACRAELQFLGERLGEAGSQRLVVVVVGRDATRDQLAAFRRAQKLRFQAVADPERDLYQRFASVQVPRTYLIDERGTLVHQTQNFSPDQGEELLRRVAALRAEMNETPPGQELDGAAAEGH